MRWMSALLHLNNCSAGVGGSSLIVKVPVCRSLAHNVERVFSKASTMTQLGSDQGACGCRTKSILGTPGIDERLRRLQHSLVP
jgi:hypothetical protein